MDKRLVFFDLETGGPDPKRHAIIQIAAIAINEQSEVLEGFETKILFDEKATKSNSLRKNHYHPGVWAQSAAAPPLAARDFAAFLRRHATVPAVSSEGDPYFVAQLVAHNATFDGPFLTTWFKRLGLFLPAHRLVLCTMQLSMWYFVHLKAAVPQNYKLATLCKHFGVPFHAASAHDALADVSATVALFQKLNAHKRVAAKAA